MAMVDKISALLAAKNDEELYTAIAKMTDKQKDMFIAAVVKSWNEERMPLEDFLKGEPK